MAEDVVMHSAIRIDSSSLYVSAYQTFSKKLDSFNSLNSGFTSPPEAFKLISCGSSLPSFPRGFSPGKRIPNTRFIVDGFRHAGAYSVAYFLTHFHSDHYTGLTPHWARGLIFCSGVTARLLVECLKVSETFIVPLEIGEAVQLDGCEVTFVDANHCPGAVQILVRVYTSANDVERYVHTGDMRYDPRMKVEPALCNFIGAETVFLDTTYCNPKFVFPSQAESIDYVARTVHGILTEQHRDNLAFKSDDKPGKCSVLFLIAAYVIGKEKIFMEVSKRCNVKIYVDKGKLEILRCLDLQVESDIFTLDATLSNVHVVGWNVLGETWPYFRPNWGRMEKMMNERGYNRVVGFVPTGWMYEVKRYSFPVRVKGCLEVHLVPYSEHSNYNELRDYMEFLRPKEIVPTVGLEGLGLDSKQAAAMLKCFANLVDETAQKRKFLKGFRRKAFDKANTEHSNDMEGERDEGQLSEKVCGNDKKTYEIVNASSPFEVPSITNTPEVESSIHVAQGEYLNASSVSSEAHCQGFGSISEISNDFVPKGSFAKGTRKRDHNFFFSSSKPEIRPPMASVNDPVPHDGSDLEVPVTDLCSPEVASARAQTQDTPKSITAAHCTDEVLQELKTCLPNWVTVDQLACLLTRSKGDMPQAVSEFYEHETELWKEVNTKTHATPVNSVSVSESSPVDPFNRQVSSNARSSLTPSKENTFHSQKSQNSSHNVCSTGPLKKACVKTPRRKSKTQSKLSRWITNSDTYKKPESPLVKKSKQSSITNFFSRTVPRMDDLRHSIREEANIKSMDQTSRNAESDESGVMDLPDLSTKVNHLLQILARCLSESDALMLLHKARGDINMAVELHYSSLERQQSLSDTYVSSRPTASGRLETIKESGASDVSRFSELSIQKATETAESDDKACLVGLPFEKYDPINHACWHAEEPAPYLHLARTFELVEQESGKLKATNMLCNMFRSLVALSPKDVLPAVYLCTNRIAPDYENIDLNIGGSTVLAAIEDAFGVQKSKLKELYNTMGDLGDVAQTCRQTQSLLVSPQALTVHQVYSALCQISKEGGTGSNARRKYIILSLLRCCREKETKFIVRTLVRNLRIGAMMRTVLPALSQAVILNSSISSAQEFFGNNIKIELQKVSAAAMEAYNIVPDLNILVPNIMNEGMNYLSRSLCIVPGIPIKPMLAKITNGIPEVVKRFRGKTFTCEFKYDGQRAQVHKSRDGSVHIFSRNCEDSTSRFPDVVDIVLSSIASNIEDFVLDGEIVAIDRYNENKIRAFQCLSSRARGRNGSLIQTENVKVDVCLFVFDLMLLNGKQLLACPLLERRKYMKELFPVAKPGYLEYAKEMTLEADEENSSSELIMDKVRGFLTEAVLSSCEGIISKALTDASEYTPSKRSDSWLKVKQDYVEGLHETLDLVPIGAWYGNGRKAGWYSPFLLACYNPESEEYQSVCRVMSGFSDAFYKEMQEFFSPERILSKKPPYYRTFEEPDVWFTPEIVWEIRGADLTISPAHQAALGLIHPSRGISLRFPRFIRERTEKKPEDSSTPMDIVDLFNQQTRKVELGIDNPDSDF